MSFGVRSELFNKSEKRFQVGCEITAKLLLSLIRYNGVKIYLYTGDTDATPTQILLKCRNNFNIHVDPERLEFVFLNQRKWIEAEKYPVMTLLGQSIGSIVLGFEALLKFQPDIFLDTMGEFVKRFSGDEVLTNVSF